MTKKEKTEHLTYAWWIGTALIFLGSLVWLGVGAMLFFMGLTLIVGAAVGLLYQGLPHGGWEDKDKPENAPPGWSPWGVNPGIIGTAGARMKDDGGTKIVS